MHIYIYAVSELQLGKYLEPPNQPNYDKIILFIIHNGTLGWILLTNLCTGVCGSWSANDIPRS
jgi:hypothetical protein